MSIAEGHPLFNILSLCYWLSFKKNESEATKNLTLHEGITFLGGNRLKLNELAKLYRKKFVLVLSVSAFCQLTNKILSMIAGSLVIDIFKKPENLIEGGHIQNGIPENGSPRNLVDQWKHVQDNFTKMEVQNQRNKDFKEKQVQFAIQLYENDEEFDCHFSLYKGGTLLTDKLERFPCPPTAVRIRSSSNAGKKATSLKTICVEWDYEDLDYPFEFLVEFRQKSNSRDERWIQKKTKTPSFCLASGPAMEVRVAMNTCIGPSEFSPVLFLPKDGNQRQPTVKSVTQTTAELKTLKSKDDKVRELLS